MEIALCHISTDYVFDGRKNKPYTPFDAPNPLSVYGESKLAGEKYIQWILNRFYIVRTCGLYGRGDNNFVMTILRLAKERQAVKVVTDQICSPTSTLNLSAGIKKLSRAEVLEYITLPMIQEAASAGLIMPERLFQWQAYAQI